MTKIITRDTIPRHSVESYNFKIISATAQSTQNTVQNEENIQNKFTEDNHPKARVSDAGSHSLSNSRKETLIESLMQKTDEMSSNFIKLQMKLEDKEEEYKNELAKTKEESFNEGIEAGIEKAKEDGENAAQEAVKLFSESIKKLDVNAQEFQTALESIKEQLMVAAIDIAKEVIDTELQENSNEIAKKLASGLIKELQSASKVTLKVNPDNHDVIKEQVSSLNNIEVTSDSAISKGGVIAISDAGNIDSEISKRFDRVKKVALSE